MTNQRSTAQINAALTAISQALDDLPYSCGIETVHVEAGRIELRVTATVATVIETPDTRPRLLLLAANLRDAQQWLNSPVGTAAQLAHRIHVVYIDRMHAIRGLNVDRVQATYSAIQHPLYNRAWELARFAQRSGR